MEKEIQRIEDNIFTNKEIAVDEILYVLSEIVKLK